MLQILFSNRIETLCDAVVRAIGAVPRSPFSAQQIIVPSSAMRRYLTLAIADRHGICANVDCVYLAEWLWHQITQVVPSVAAESPFAADALAWRIYQILQESTWQDFPRLANYLKQRDDVMRFELATAIAALFEQYITYRQDWMNAWLRGESLSVPTTSAAHFEDALQEVALQKASAAHLEDALREVALQKASAAHLEDESWQAELWRRIGDQLGAAHDHPASLLFRRLETAQSAGGNPFDLPETVHVFCLPAMPPLYLAMLTGLARWIDVTLYVLNPCREYWFDIVDPKRLRALMLRGAASHHDMGNRLLSSWGKQTKAHIELLLDRAGDAPVDDGGFDDRFPPTMLGQLQHAIFTLTELEPAGFGQGPLDRSIEVHVCHSLTRELEVLQDQLLALFAGPSRPRPEEILIVTPDLEAAAPLIEAVFGHVPDERRLPYAITGRGRGAVNAVARALLALLAILSSRFPASALVELMQQPLIGRRFGIGAEELQIIEGWLRDSGIRWGIDAEHRRELGVPGTERFSITDGLDRLFLGYALPRRVSAPTFDRIPAGDAEGSQAAILGSFAEFVQRLTALRADLREPRLPEAWLEALLGLVDSFLAPVGDDLEDLAEVRETLRELETNMGRGGLTTPVPLSVLRAGLESLFDDTARGGVPTGSITFSSMSSLRNLPFRFVGIIGLGDGAFPAAARPREFDLMAAQPRAGDRQRRLDDRNLFLDLILAARERLYLSYTGRSIRDDSVRPPSVVVAELIETLLPALARGPLDAASLAEARERLIIEHPLQAFAETYFRGDDPRRRSFNRELCEALRHALTDPGPSRDDHARDDAGSNDDDAAENRAAAGGDGGPDDDPAGRSEGALFFAAPLAVPGPEWRRVSLDQLLQFFRNPCAFLLRQRLGMSLYREEDGVADQEPFIPDFGSRQALAERLLPQAMAGLGAGELSDLARAGVEYPPGALGRASLGTELGSLQRFALEVRDATRSPLPALPVDLAFVMEGEDWRLAALLAGLYDSGPVLHRYDDTRTSDYLAAWLTHLVAAAASPTPTETRWISRNGGFRFTDCSGARPILERILLLYRRGLREPIHFFPKSAWEFIQTGRNLDKARAVWHPNYGPIPGEDRHAAYRLALRGVEDPLDADFQACADTVFGPSGDYLDDARL